MLFAALVLEREPTRWSDLPNGLLSWVQDVGMLAAVVVVPFLVYYLVQFAQRSPRAGDEDEETTSMPLLLGVALIGILGGYAVAFAGWLLGADYSYVLDAGKLIGGICSLGTVFVPFVAGATRLRWRRIWALAVVSFKEAVRRRILWVFAFLLIGFLFAGWFLSSKDEDQVSGYVAFISMAMALLLLIPAGLLGAFGIPNDLKNQTIYTIVTKPVERFEIYLGRFLGYTMLMSLVLVVMTGLSLIYVARGVSPEAAYESLRARVPLFGELTLEPRGENLSVGREWEYRKYIEGGNAAHRAIWSYRRLPSDLATRTEPVPCEFYFDIFRTTKGDEKVGVLCTFEFRSGRMDDADIPRYLKERKALLATPGANPQQVDEDLATKYGYFVDNTKEITDYHTDQVMVPVGVFKHALAGDPQPDPDQPEVAGPRLRVIVRSDSRTQYVGMAKRDLYLLDAERSAYLNFFKGAAGLWLLLCLILGIAIALSTQLNGVVSFIVTMFLFVAGMFPDHVLLLSQGKAEGGGPAQAALRMFRGVPSPTIPIEASPGRTLAEAFDALYQRLFIFLRMIIPDVETYDLSEYIAKGFNVSLFDPGGDDLLLKAVILLGYLLPWALGAFYLLRWREVAA